MFNIPDSMPPITIALPDYVQIDRLIHTDSAQTSAPHILKYLARELNRAEIVATKELPAHVVGMYSTVAYADSHASATRTMTLVFPHEADSPGNISLLSPVGAALIGMEVGRSITWYTPATGEHTIKILAVTQPTADAR